MHCMTSNSLINFRTANCQNILITFLSNSQITITFKQETMVTLKIPNLKHTFARNSIRYCVPIVYNNCPLIDKNKIYTHSMGGFARYVKIIRLKNITLNVKLGTAIFAEDISELYKCLHWFPSSSPNPGGSPVATHFCLWGVFSFI